MPWTSPGTAVAGDVLTAARWNSDVRDNSLMGSPVFTNEAARDAAITAPVEGQMCYLTAPTIPAATGSSTFVPTGIRTIYNGSVWVCVTQVGGFSNGTGTTTSTTFTSTLTGGGTNASATLVTGTTALVHLRGMVENTGTGASIITVAVSGAGTVAGSEENAIYISAHTAAQQHVFGTTMILGGLTAGTNTFTIQYRVVSGTGTFYARGITVQGIA